MKLRYFELPIAFPNVDKVTFPTNRWVAKMFIDSKKQI